jgi:Na+-translocating ferredoxin:NAD+ oxidoreductase RnfE subunit
MTSFLRFFVLALTPLLAVTVSVGPAFLFGLTATAVLTAVAALVFALRKTLKEPALLWSALGLTVVLVTLVDLVTSLWLPGVRAVWGLYLNLLAFSPLVVVLPIEKPQAPSWGAELGLALKTGLLLTLLFLVTALVRETLGHGSFTLIPATATWSLPGLSSFPATILTTGAGGFFLAAAAVVGYRALRPRLMKLASVNDFLAAGQGPIPAEVAEPVVSAPPESNLPESTEDWGEDLAATVAALASTGTGKRRLLVIGSGNGELPYYLSMLCLDQAKGASFEFRIRGVDHFATRIETAVKGVYRDHQIDFIPQKVRDAWMTRGQGEDRLWRVNNDPRLHVQFEIADFQQGPLFFPQPCHLIVLNQGIEYVSDDKKVQLLNTVCDHILTGGALVVVGPFRRELLPEGMKRTGTTVFRKS